MLRLCCVTLQLYSHVVRFHLASPVQLKQEWTGCRRGTAVMTKVAATESKKDRDETQEEEVDGYHEKDKHRE